MTKMGLADWKEDEIILKMVELYDAGYTIKRISTLLMHEDGVLASYQMVRDILIELDVTPSEIRFPGCNPDVPTIESNCVHLITSPE